MRNCSGKQKSPTGKVRLFLFFLSKFRIPSVENKTAKKDGGFGGCGRGRERS
jgi:hypothetical protein